MAADVYVKGGRKAIALKTAKEIRFSPEIEAKALALAA